MSRSWIFLFLISVPVILCAQNYPSQPQPYQPAVPPPSEMNSYGGYSSSPGTVAGSSLNGMANVISARGNYNLSTSAAAVNMTQAERNSIQNAQLYTDTYFQMRSTNRAARRAESGPPPTMEQIARIAHQGAPRPVTEKEVNSASGKVNWPSVLTQKSYEKDRTKVETIISKQVQYGGLSFDDQMQARKSIESMFTTLKDGMDSIPPQQFIDSKNFLNSMIYATCKCQL
jgi:hypothetical protein